MAHHYEEGAMTSHYESTLENQINGIVPDTNTIVAGKMTRLLYLRAEIAGLETKRTELADLERELSAIINPKPVRVPKVSRKKRAPRTATGVGLSLASDRLGSTD